MAIPPKGDPYTTSTPVIPPKIGHGQPVVGATLVVACSPTPTHIHPLTWPSLGHGDPPERRPLHNLDTCHSSKNRPRPTRRRGNPCGCLFPDANPYSSPYVAFARTCRSPKRRPLHNLDTCHSSENRPRPTRRRGNPCGCLFPDATKCPKMPHISSPSVSSAPSAVNPPYAILSTPPCHKMSGNVRLNQTPSPSSLCGESLPRARYHRVCYRMHPEAAKLK